MKDYNLRQVERPEGLLKAVEKLMYWAQVSLPAVYGEELTYAKEQGVMAEKINEIVAQLNVNTEWTQYLLNEGVEAETVTYINALIENGTLGSLINNDLLGSINGEIIDTNNELNALAGRVSQLEASGVPSDTELINIRVDATGKEWTSAGEAVRAIGRGEAFYPDAINQLLTSFWKKYNLMDITNATDGTLNTTGDVVPADGYYVTDFIPVTPGDMYSPLPSNVWGINIRMGTWIAFYKIDKTFLERANISNPLNITVPQNAAYCRIANTKVSESFACIIKSDDLKYLNENNWVLKDIFVKYGYEYINEILNNCHVERINGYTDPTVTGGVYYGDNFNGLRFVPNANISTAKTEIVESEIFVGVLWPLTGNYTQSCLCIFLDENLNYLDNGYPLMIVEDSYGNDIAMVPIPRGAKYVYSIYRNADGLYKYRVMVDDEYFKKLKLAQLNDENISLKKYFRVDNYMTFTQGKYRAPNLGSKTGIVDNSNAAYGMSDLYPVNKGEVYSVWSNVPRTGNSAPLMITYDSNKIPMRFIYSKVQTSMTTNVEIGKRESFISINYAGSNLTSIASKRQFKVGIAIDDCEIWKWSNDSQLNINQMVQNDGSLINSEVYSSANVGIKQNTMYRITDVGGGSLAALTTRVAFYDANGNFISAVNSDNFRLEYYPVRWLDVISPANATKMVVNFQNTFNGGDIKKAVRVYECKAASAEYSNIGNFKDKYITYYGDSITYYGGWGDILRNYFNWNGYNYGTSSATIAQTSNPSLCNDGTLENMLSTKPDMVIIMGGVNDKGSLVPIGDIANINKPLDQLDKTKFVEAYAYIIKYVQSKFPETKIIIMTPSPSRAGGFDVPTSIGLNSIDYSNAAKQVAYYFGLQVVDLRGLNDYSEYTMPLLMMDNVHWTYNLETMAADNIIMELTGSPFMVNKNVNPRFVENNLIRMLRGNHSVCVIKDKEMVPVNKFDL